MDKLTQPTTVKLSPDMAHTARLVAESAGMELSEYIRHLLASDIERARVQYATLHQVFGRPDAESTFTSGDEVGHKTKTRNSRNCGGSFDHN